MMLSSNRLTILGVTWSFSCNFRSFYVITDSLSVELKKGVEKYNTLYNTFRFLEDLKQQPSLNISEKATELWKAYPNDLKQLVIENVCT